MAQLELIFFPTVLQTPNVCRHAQIPESACLHLEEPEDLWKICFWGDLKMLPLFFSLFFIWTFLLLCSFLTIMKCSVVERGRDSLQIHLEAAQQHFQIAFWLEWFNYRDLLTPVIDAHIWFVKDWLCQTNQHLVALQRSNKLGLLMQQKEAAGKSYSIAFVFK